MIGIGELAFLQETEIMVPFLFTLAITFGLLNLTNVFKNKGAHFIISLALSIFAITSPTFVNLLWSYFGSVTVFFIALFLLALILETFGLRKLSLIKDYGGSLVIQIAVLFLLLTLGFYYSDRLPTLPYLGSGENALFLFAILLILSIFWAVYRMQQTGPIAAQRQ